MLFVILAILVYWFNPAGNILIDNLALIAIGFLIYGPVMMIGLQAADMVPRVATGGATGLTGLLGYLIGSAGAGAFMGLMVDLYGWMVVSLPSLVHVSYPSYSYSSPLETKDNNRIRTV